MEDIRSAIKLISIDSFMASIDLKDAYHLISIRPSDRKYLRFSWQGQLFEFLGMPFGLCTAPWVFTKLVKPVTNHLRSLGFMSVVYLDDWLCIDKNYASRVINVQRTKQTIKKLGFVLNFEKSSLVPSQKCQFLGFILNAPKMTLELPDRKKEKILSKVKEFKNKNTCCIRELAQQVGTLTSSCPAVEYGWLHMKAFERCRYLALLASCGNYDSKMIIRNYLKLEFEWWINTIPKVVNPIRSGNYELEIFSDASLTGWGAYCGSELTFGHWTEWEKCHHINHI